jgi:transcriptional regulator with XRE-family HTH domain
VKAMIIEFNNLKDLLIFNIKYYRYKNNISQEKLAERCSLSPRYITDIERGLHCPTIPKIEKIAASLNIEPYVLFQNCKRDIKLVKKINDTRQYNQTLYKKK